eukprot:3795597-Pyramimonas_sp.AAC.1
MWKETLLSGQKRERKGKEPLLEPEIPPGMGPRPLGEGPRVVPAHGASGGGVGQGRGPGSHSRRRRVRRVRRVPRGWRRRSAWSSRQAPPPQRGGPLARGSSH